MILVSALYAACHLPHIVLYVVATAGANLRILDGGYYATRFLAFVYITANPFIYATKFDPVKKILKDMIPGRKPTNLVTPDAAGTSGNRTNKASSDQKPADMKGEK